MTRVLAERYELVEPLGAGAMATVWRGRDERLDREVAIKVLTARLADDVTFRSRFEREAKLVASLKHPNVVTVYDSGTEDGSYYIVMELVEGQSLQANLATASSYMGLSETRELAREVLAGLGHAHRKGIFHRDIKPANILITTEGMAKLADFGIAKGTADAQSLTATGSYLGTPLYSAPEQISGQDPNAATDIYSLGCVLYQCLVGRPPFEADTPMGVMAHHLHAAPRSLRSQRPDIPPQLEATVLRALEKDPERRFASAEEMDRSLSAAAATTPGAEALSTVTAPGPSVIGEEDQPPARRRWWRVVAAVAGGVAILAAGISVPLALSAGGRGPASTPSKAAETAFDSCLVGQWTVQSATLPIAIGSQTTLVSGGRGTRTVFSPNGTEADDFNQSAPFEGTVNGPPFVVTVRGNALTPMTARNGTITVLAGSTSSVTANAAILGQQTTIPLPPTAAGTTFSYSCASNSLSFTRGAAQVVLYAR